MTYSTFEKDLVLVQGADKDVISYINEHIQKGNLNKENGFEYIGEGEEAEVYGYQSLAIKIKKKNTPNIVLFNDISIYQKLNNTIPLFPKMHAFKQDEFVVLERVQGNTLADLGMLSVEQIKFFPDNLKQQLLTGLEAALSLGLLPKDIHLNNMIVSLEHTQIKIVDVGGFHLVNEKYYDVIHPQFRKQDTLYNTLLKTG